MAGHSQGTLRRPLIAIDGSAAGHSDGLTITGSNVTVRGLDIGGFAQGAGIHITEASTTGNWIYGNFLGTDPSGRQAVSNKEGVEIDAGAVNNLVGTNGDGVNDASERNLLSGNLFAGVWITGQGTSNNAVAGNFIGTDITGNAVAGNFVAGSFIGTDITGSVALKNGTQPVTDSQGNTFGGGIVLSDGTSDNRIGTDGKSVDDVGERNVIAGSKNDGIDIYGTGTDGNVVAANFIGTDVTGTGSLSIAGDGVFLAEGASSNWIGVNPSGGQAISAEGNVISGNGDDGVQIVDSANDNVVAGNKIGTDVTGTVALGNNYQGVEVDSGSVDNTIGGTTAGAGNVISANDENGIWITGAGTTGVVVQHNFIGTDVTGTKALGNAFCGVAISGRREEQYHRRDGGRGPQPHRGQRRGRRLYRRRRRQAGTWCRATSSAPMSPAPAWAIMPSTARRHPPPASPRQLVRQPPSIGRRGPSIRRQPPSIRRHQTGRSNHMRGNQPMNRSWP